MENTTTSAAADWHSKVDPFGSGEHWIYDGDDNFVASVAFVRDGKKIDSEKTDAHADLIVRACNSHDDLLAALEDAAEALASFYGADHKAAGHHFGAALKARMEKVITKAKSHGQAN